MILNKECCYFLGFFWADGYMWLGKRHSQYNIILENSTRDLETLMPTFAQLGHFYIYKRFRKNSKNEVMRATMYSKENYNFLVENGFMDKISRHKILDIIPDELKHYFWRGLWDGDGCIGIYKRKVRGSIDYRMEICSDIRQDWSEFEILCRLLNISFHIKRKKQRSNTHSVSLFQIGKIKDMETLGDYLYRNYEQDNIGLKRKHDKFLIIKNHAENSTHWKLNPLKTLGK